MLLPPPNLKLNSPFKAPSSPLHHAANSNLVNLFTMTLDTKKWQTARKERGKGIGNTNAKLTS